MPARKPVALTVKIGDDIYMRLGKLRASQRRTHQDILKQALEEYLDRVGA
jgi:predicted transcriptional regulator